MMPRCEAQFRWSATLVSMKAKVLNFTVAGRSVNFSFSVAGHACREEEKHLIAQEDYSLDFRT